MRLDGQWSVAAVLSTDRRPPDPTRLAAFGALGTMSDALLKLIQPYIDWPPCADEIAELEEWLAVGAAVWNATVQAKSGTELRERLSLIADQWEFPNGRTHRWRLVEEIAVRKLEILAEDYRVVGDVQVRVEGSRATVQAVSVAHLR